MEGKTNKNSLPMDSEDGSFVAVNLLARRDVEDTTQKVPNQSMVVLPDYVLDFGYVLPGKVLTSVLNVTNSGTVPLSLSANTKGLKGTGFSVESEKVKNLPCGETHAFTVKFNSQESKLKMGQNSVFMPVQASHGGRMKVQLCAVLTLPSVAASPLTLDFDSLQCGMCQIKRVQLKNNGFVVSHWNMAEEVKPLKKVDKFVPLYKRKKPQPRPVVFEMIPSSGTLCPGEQVDVQIKFCPTEGVSYSRRLIVSVAENPQQTFLTACGQAEDPQLHFSPSLLDVGACLPSSTDTEMEVSVKNLSSFPVEFYSLELDKQYLEEEKMLRLILGDDEKSQLLIPPLHPGQGLPREVLEYSQSCSHLRGEQLDDTVEDRQSADPKAAADLSRRISHLGIAVVTKAGRSTTLGPLTPVPSAVSDPEHRGGVIIVYGAPLTDTSSVAGSLADYYGVARLSVDAVVSEALVNGSTPVSLKARQLYDAAVAKFEEKKTMEAAQTAKRATQPQPEADSPSKSTSAPREPAEVPPATEAPPATVPHQDDSQVPQRDGSTVLQLRLLQEARFPLSELLPPDLLVDLLTERFQEADCCRGLLLHGLASVFTCSAAAVLQTALKALKSRQHIYMVNVHDTFHAMKARESARRQAEEARKRETAEKELRWLQSLDDEQFQGLPDQVQKKIVQQHVTKVQQKKLQEKKLRELERMAKEEEERMIKLKEEELLKAKTAAKKDVKDPMKRKSTAESAATLKTSPPNKDHPGQPPQSAEAPSSPAKEADPSQKASKESQPALEEPAVEVDERQALFSAYQKSCEQVKHVLQHWDLARGVLLLPFPDHEPSAAPATRKQTPSAKASAKTRDKSASAEALKTSASTVDAAASIPLIVMNVTGEERLATEELLRNASLPTLDQLVVDDAPISTPTPQSIIYSVLPFPKQRAELNELSCDCFTFLTPSGPVNQKEKEGDSVEEAQTSASKAAALTRSQSRGSAKESSREQDKRGRDSRTKRRAASRVSPMTEAAAPSCMDHHTSMLDTKRKQSLARFRWIVPAHGEVLLKIWFYSEHPGTFSQTFNFELMGTGRLYQLPCRGICTYPSICSNYMTLFPTCKKVKTMSEKLEKAYVTDPGYFEFGPLLCSKTRDRYREVKYPENTENLVIHNNSDIQAEVQFSFKEDNHGATFLLNPPTMILQPGQKQELAVWAYPTKVGQMRDSILCCVQNNLSRFSIDVSCWGVRPELKLEAKSFAFDRVILHREESRTILLHNKTALPVSWRLLGIEELGDDFSVPQSEGIIAVASSFPLSLNFKARRPLIFRKNLRLEISDAERILGIVHSENLTAGGEAYDVALEISPEGCLNFGILRVFEENKLTLKIKNQGKFDIAFKFLIQQTAPTLPDLASVFTICPQGGILRTHDKATTLHILCRPTSEFSVREQPILSCQVIEPKLGDGGEVIAIVAINVSVIAVFSRYKITPAHDLNFGPLAYGCKKNQSFTIENTGVLESRFKISPMVAPAAGRNAQKNKSDRSAGAAAKARRESMAKDSRAVQTTLSVGVFSLSPCAGALQPGSVQMVTVYCMSEQLGVWNQGLLIDISDRDPSQHTDGIPYSLFAEVCKPSLVSDPDSIFEEYYICSSSWQLSSEPFCSAEHAYVQEENRFIFQKVPVGQTVQAHFKLSNNSKVSCTVSLAVRTVGVKERQASQSPDVFDLSSTTVSIPSQSHSFASVTFTPQMMQLYNAVFEATLEQSSRFTPTSRSKALEFHLTGESVLPHVSVLCPTVRNSAGSPVINFRRVSVGNRHARPLVLLNNGYFPVQVQVNLLDESDLFSLRPSPGNTCSFIPSAPPQGPPESTPPQGPSDSEGPAGSRLRMSLNVNEQVRLEVVFYSDRPTRAQTRILMCLEDNKHITTTIQVVAEACQDIVAFHNLNESAQELVLDDEKGSCEVLSFGDCDVNQTYQQSFMMTNHSSSRAFRFSWNPAGQRVCFLPQVGHLHAGCSKEVAVMFRSADPVTLKTEVVCKLCEVAFEQPLEDVADWGDRQRSLQWLQASRQTSAAAKQISTAKMGKTDEPSCSVVDGSQWDMKLWLCAVCDYVVFKCSADTISFQDTMIYQSRHQQFQITNDGKVKLEFSFQLFLDPSNNHVEDDSSAADSEGDEAPPISVEPCTGAIEAGKMKIFTVSFSPVRVAQYQARLVCSIPNLQRGRQAPCVRLCGRGLLPRCHFYLEDADVIRRLSGNSDFTGHLDTDTRVLEFSSIVFAPSVRSFGVLNPTTEPYTFRWRCEDSDCSPFRCLSPRGTILPGQTVQARFEYVSEKMAQVCSSWSFVVESPAFSVPFLCVGLSREPQLFFSKRQLDFGELPLGFKAQQLVELVNCEEEAFHFSVLQSSLLCEDQRSSLRLEPLSGVIQPSARLPLTVSFTPCCQGQKRFRLALRVRRKPEPLVVTVKASCLPMAAALQVEMPDRVVRKISPEQEHTLDFGEVERSEQSLFYFLLTNQSKFRMDVTLELTGNVNLLQHLKVDQHQAVVDVDGRLQTSLLFSPKGVCCLQDVSLKVKVKLGPTYLFAIKGRCSPPSLEFSFTRHDFGKCLLHRSGMVPASTTLVICNKGLKDVGLQCAFRNSPWMELDCGTHILAPGALLDVPIRFLPRDLCSYHEKVTFILNSCITREVTLLGHGVKMKLEVEDPRQRKINLGSLNSGRKVKRKVKVVNRSCIDVSFKLLLNTQLDQRDLSISQTGELNLRAGGGSCLVDILFSPHQRLLAFTAELQAQCAGVSYPLLTLQGSCPGVKVQLDQDHLAFGAVVQHCQVSRKIVMMNSGDVGTSFCWKTDKSARSLTITPAKGFIHPGVDIPLDVTFAPVTLSDDIRFEASCTVGSSSVVGLTVTGSCILVSTNKEVVLFSCPVRGSHTQVLQVNNPTSEECRIVPVLKGGPWRLEPFLDFEPLENKMVSISYQPMTMLADGKKDLASVFFSFPDGSGIKFKLQGTAGLPKVEDTIVCELPAKTRHTVALCVHNWLPKKQQFRVLMEFVKPDKPDATMSISGLPFIDVPALARKDYQMSFFTYREGQYQTKVTFQNATSGEYLFYLVTFESLPAGPLSTVELVATVREKVSGSVTVENPLSSATCLTLECKCPEISAPAEHTVPGESKGCVSFEYQPLHAKQSTARLSLHSLELGLFHYDLSLRALPAPPEKTVHFSIPLGRSQVELVKFLNYSHVKTDYACSLDSPDFTVDKSVTAYPGYRPPAEAAVSVCFEPHQLGEVRGLLSLSSDIGGHYTFVLHGTCTPPQAQGPFTIKPGRTLNIPFKNVFLHTTTYSFQVNNPCFVVRAFTPNLGPKKTQNIPVFFEVPAENPQGPWFGTLSISCRGNDVVPFFWDYYLQSSIPEPS